MVELICVFVFAYADWLFSVLSTTDFLTLFFAIYELQRKKTGLCVFGFLVRSDISQSVQSQKKVRSLKFWILQEEGLYYPRSESKDVDQLCRSAQLICTFVLAKS